MCKADMTPIPWFMSPVVQEPFPNFEVEHTCRDFHKLVKWAKSRKANVENEAEAALKFHESLIGVFL
jgi:Mycotoxin biosynthesis protein UstYa